MEQGPTPVPSSPYLLGVLLALTNLVSPTFLPSLSFVMGVVHARGRVGHSVGENAPYAVGVGVAELLMSSLSETRAM